MEKSKIYNLIDSLTELQRIAPSLIPEKAVGGINDFCDPVAVYVKILSPDSKLFEKSLGNLTHLETLIKFEDKFKNLGVNSAEFALDFTGGQIISCASINHPKEYSGSIMVMTESDNPFKYIIRQIIDLFAGNIILALSLQSLERHFDIKEFMDTVFPEMKHFSVEGILAYIPDSPQKTYWVDQKTSKQIVPAAELIKVLMGTPGDQGMPVSENIQSLIPSSQKFNNFAWSEFSLGGRTIICLFAGKFKKNDLVFSKFRSLIADIDQPTGYDDIVQAFNRLKEDHKQVVKGERVAAILETAVAINHEINNPLTAVLGNTQLLLMQENQLSEDVIAKVKVIEKSALRIRQVTQKLMTIVEPVTTSYTDNLEMLDINKSTTSK